MIEHANIIFMPTISELGGIETYVYELVKKYHYLDIAVVSNSCHPSQAERIRKYCKLYIHRGEKIKCKVAIINYDQSIISYIDKDAKIYQAIHADYTHPRYNGRKPAPHPRITAFIAITEFLQDKMKAVLEPNKTILSYNPLTIDDDKPIIIVCPSRLHAFKGKTRMQEFANEMDKRHKNWLLICITSDIGGIDSPNVIFIPPRLDISKFLQIATYVMLLSDSEACSYTLNEALYRNIPILTTPLPYLDEIGYKDGKTGYTIEFDCSNIKDVVDKIDNVPKFQFKHLEDKYAELFSDDPSHYESDKNILVQVQATKTYDDLELKRRIEQGEIIDEPIRLERAEHLERRGCVKILCEVNDKNIDKKE